jgi:hypothetical protein
LLPGLYSNHSSWRPIKTCIKYTLNDSKAELVNWHAGDGTLARGLGAGPDSAPYRPLARALIWDDEPDAHDSNKFEFVGPPLPGLKLAAAFFDVLVIDYGVQVLDWD